MLLRHEATLFQPHTPDGVHRSIRRDARFSNGLCANICSKRLSVFDDIPDALPAAADDIRRTGADEGLTVALASVDIWLKDRRTLDSLQAVVTTPERGSRREPADFFMLQFCNASDIFNRCHRAHDY